MATIKGKWLFNETITIPSADIEQAVNFTTSGTLNDTAYTELNCISMKVDVSSNEPLKYKVDSATPEWDYNTAYYGVYWDSFYEDGFRTVDFGSAEQEVSDEYKAWFTANANEVKATATIKSGTYRFNDVLTAITADFEQNIQFTISGEMPNISDKVVINGSVIDAELSLTEEGEGYTRGMWYKLDSSNVDLSSYYINLPSKFTVYHEDFSGWSPYYGDVWQTITIPTDQEVSTEFAEWFSASAAPVVEGVQISGMWKFKDELTGNFGYLSQPVTFEYNYKYVVSQDEVAEYNAFLDEVAASDGISVDLSDVIATTYNVKMICTWMGGTEVESFGYQHSEAVTTPHSVGLSMLLPINNSNGGHDTTFYYNGWYKEEVKTIDFGTEPQTVSAEFYNWLTANADPIIPAATITHNGEVIAELNAGQTATLKCAGMKMLGDIIVSIAKHSGGSGGSSDDKTSGPLYIAENGFYDHAYESSSVIWSENTEYDFSLPMDELGEGVMLRVKKMTDLIVPDHVNYLMSPAYTLTIKLPDGTEQSMPFSELEMFSIDDAGSMYMSNSLFYTVVWVKDADIVNETIGAPIFESNSVYVTDFLWMMSPDMSGIGVELVLTAPSKKLDGISSVEVDAITEPELQYKDVYITESGSYYQSVRPDDGYDGLGAVYIGVDVPKMPTTYILQTSDELPTDAIYGSFAIVLGG